MTGRIRKALGAAALAAMLVATLAAPAAAQLRLNFSFGDGGGSSSVSFGDGVSGRRPGFGAQVQFAQSGQCWSNREIRQAVVEGRILSLAAALQAAGVGADAQVLNASVCTAAIGPVWYLSVLGPSGQAQNIALNAANGLPYIGQ